MPSHTSTQRYLSLYIIYMYNIVVSWTDQLTVCRWIFFRCFCCIFLRFLNLVVFFSLFIHFILFQYAWYWYTTSNSTHRAVARILGLKCVYMQSLKHGHVHTEDSLIDPNCTDGAVVYVYKVDVVYKQNREWNASWPMKICTVHNIYIFASVSVSNIFLSFYTHLYVFGDFLFLLMLFFFCGFICCVVFRILAVVNQSWTN